MTKDYKIKPERYPKKTSKKTTKVEFKLQIEWDGRVLIVEDPLLTEIDVFKRNLKILQGLLEISFDEYKYARDMRTKITESTGVPILAIYKYIRELINKRVISPTSRQVHNTSANDLLPLSHALKLKIEQQNKGERPKKPIVKKSSKLKFQLQIKIGDCTLVVEDPLLTDLDLFKNNLKVLQCLLENSSLLGYAYITTTEIGETIGLSQAFVYKYIRDLRNKGIVAKYGEGVYLLSNRLVPPIHGVKIESQDENEWIEKERMKFIDPSSVEVEVQFKWKDRSAKLSNSLFTDLNLFNNCMKVLSFLFVNCSSDGHIYNTREQMSEAIGVAPLTIRYYLYNLMDKGLIIKEGRDTYRLADVMIPIREEQHE